MMNEKIQKAIEEVNKNTLERAKEIEKMNISAEAKIEMLANLNSASNSAILALIG